MHAIDKVHLYLYLVSNGGENVLLVFLTSRLDVYGTIHELTQ